MDSQKPNGKPLFVHYVVFIHKEMASWNVSLFLWQCGLKVPNVRCEVFAQEDILEHLGAFRSAALQ
jgi:hypothetical protein